MAVWQVDALPYSCQQCLPSQSCCKSPHARKVVQARCRLLSRTALRPYWPHSPPPTPTPQVLDDNKVLTLANGDRILMTPTMKAMFEPENLNNASPATVSRAGIIYVSDSELGWGPVAESWLQVRAAGRVGALQKPGRGSADATQCRAMGLEGKLSC